MSLGIIDIGYNAIRAVVYEDNNIGAPEIFNNKFKNDILNLLTNESLDIKHQAYLSIQYIIHIFDRLNVNNIKCVATAVLRNHPRALEFTEFIKAKYNLDIEIISGEKEAFLTARGLLVGIGNVDGVAADLGGGSLEIVELNQGNIGKLNSFALGTKVLAKQNLLDVNKISDLIRSQYGGNTCDNLYFIGGALRFICRFFIDFTKYPLKNLHNLEIPSDQFLDYLEKLNSSSACKSTLGKRKIDHYALLVTSAMMQVFEPKRIIVSTFGLKEGVRSELITNNIDCQDIIIEKIKYLSKYNETNTDFDQYHQILEKLLIKQPDSDKLLKMSIMLLSMHKHLDQTVPPRALVEGILSSEIPFTHKIRVMLALIISYSTNQKTDVNLLKIAKKLLSKEEQANSQIIGDFLRIAKEVDGSVFTIPTFNIVIRNNFLEIVSNEILPRPIFEKICERLKSIALAKKIHSN